jgi:sigma-B regulation protein RsbU (phosphoserine phosphatase)
VLGVLPDSNYEGEAITLRRGDVLVLYTDGAVEAENPAGEQYSAKRLSRTVSLHPQQTAGELIKTIYASVMQFRQTRSRADDLTLVVLKKLPGAANRPRFSPSSGCTFALCSAKT